MRFLLTSSLCLFVSSTSFAAVTAVQTPFGLKADVIELKNDAFVDNGGQAYLQLGFVAEEKAGIWVKVPENIGYFKVDSFRVLMGSSAELNDNSPEERNVQIFFDMAIASQPSAAIPADITNAAQITPGPYWNDIPAQGEQGSLSCARGGQYVGAALEFTHTGAPSVYRDLDGLNAPTHNNLFAVPGGWGYSVQYGLRGDWILRVVGHSATAAECGY